MNEERKLYSLREMIQYCWSCAGIAAFIVAIMWLEKSNWVAAFPLTIWVGYLINMWAKRDYFADEEYRMMREREARIASEKTYNH